MGMTNKNITTNINTGELSEFIFSLAVIGKQTKTEIESIFDILVCDTQVHGSYKGITFFGDGKLVPAYKEIAAAMDGISTDLVDDMVDTIKNVVNNTMFPEFDTIRACGGSSDKDDITLYKNGIRVMGYSLKWGHDAVERSQSPSWSSVVEFYGKFTNMSPLQEYYINQQKVFTTPAYRYSDKKGDWSPELIKNGQIMQDTVRVLEEYVADKFISKTVDFNYVASGIIKSYTGNNDVITFIELVSGDVKVYNRDIIKNLVDKMSSSVFTVSYVESKTGKTRDTVIYMNGIQFIKFRTTASADKAPGQFDRDLRRVKRQTYLEVSLPV